MELWGKRGTFSSSEAVLAYARNISNVLLIEKNLCVNVSKAKIFLNHDSYFKLTLLFYVAWVTLECNLYSNYWWRGMGDALV